MTKKKNGGILCLLWRIEKYALISLIIQKLFNYDLSRQWRKQLKAGEGWGGVTQQKVSAPIFSVFSCKYLVINQKYFKQLYT